LLLAWPTFGISIIVWAGAAWMISKQKLQKIETRREEASKLEPIFEDRYAEFFNALHVPLKPAVGAIAHDDEFRCGRHIMNYIAHNSGELSTFMAGLQSYPRADGQMCNPAIAVELDRRLGGKRETFTVCIRAIEAIMTRNPDLACFKSIDLERLKLTYNGS